MILNSWMTRRHIQNPITLFVTVPALHCVITSRRPDSPRADHGTSTRMLFLLLLLLKSVCCCGSGKRLHCAAAARAAGASGLLVQHALD